MSPAWAKGAGRSGAVVLCPGCSLEETMMSRFHPLWLGNFTGVSVVRVGYKPCRVL
jgi:hypothetical protein